VKVGDRLRAFAHRVCSTDTRDRVIDPLIADLQFEHDKAIRAGRIWHARQVRVSAYLAFWTTFAMCAGRSVQRWAAADQHAIGRTIAYSAAIIASLTLLLALMPLTAVLQRQDVHPRGISLLYIVPQAIPIALTFGLPLGILVGLRGRLSTTRIRWSIMSLCFIGTALSFVVCGWVLPATNQAFRESLFNPPRFLARGANELTFGELSSQLTALERQGRLDKTSPLLYSYHARLAASAAPLIWGVFALALSSVTRRTLLSTMTVIVAGVTYVTVAAFIIDGSGTLYPWLPLRFVIWLPNALFAVMTIAVWTHRPTQG
jgi:hypothetical protein